MDCWRLYEVLTEVRRVEESQAWVITGDVGMSKNLSTTPKIHMGGSHARDIGLDQRLAHPAGRSQYYQGVGRVHPQRRDLHLSVPRSTTDSGKAGILNPLRQPCDQGHKRGEVRLCPRIIVTDIEKEISRMRDVL